MDWEEVDYVPPKQVRTYEYYNFEREILEILQKLPNGKSIKKKCRDKSHMNVIRVRLKALITRLNLVGVNYSLRQIDNEFFVFVTKNIPEPITPIKSKPKHKKEVDSIKSIPTPPTTEINVPHSTDNNLTVPQNNSSTVSEKQE